MEQSERRRYRYTFTEQKGICVRIARYLFQHKFALLMVVAIFVLQAICDLALPAYTSDIVDVGIQQSGIPDAVPEELSPATHDALAAQLAGDDAALFDASYAFEGSRYVYRHLGKMARETLSDALVEPLIRISGGVPADEPDSASAWAQDAHTELYAMWQSNTPTTISLAGAKVAAIKARTYTGKAIKPAVTVTLSGKTLKKGTDYTVAYKNNTNAGTATVTIKGKGDYTGTVTASFKINPASLAKAKVAAIQARTYTGKAIKSAVTVTLSGKTLKKGADYTVAYKNNKAIGKASVTIKGKGNYTASVSKTFAINPKAVSLASLTAGKGQLTVKWKKGTGGAGYQLEYSLKKSFVSSTKVKIAKAATVSRVLKNLKAGKTYYVRIRGYKLVGGKAYVSPWSKALSKKVK